MLKDTTRKNLLTLVGFWLSIVTVALIGETIGAWLFPPPAKGSLNSFQATLVHSPCLRQPAKGPAWVAMPLVIGGKSATGRIEYVKDIASDSTRQALLNLHVGDEVMIWLEKPVSTADDRPVIWQLHHAGLPYASYEELLAAYKTAESRRRNVVLFGVAILGTLFVAIALVSGHTFNNEARRKIPKSSA